MIQRDCPKNVISFGTETNILARIASIGLVNNVILAERCEPQFYPSKRIWRFLRSFVYITNVTLVAQTTGASNFFSKVRKRNKHVIPNPVITIPSSSYKRKKQESTTILSAGRLVEQKNFSLLIHALKNLNQKIQWNLLFPRRPSKS